MSQRIKSTLEILVGIILVFGYFWLILPLYYQSVKVLSAIPIYLFFIYSNYRNKKTLKDLGLRLDNWYDSFKILLIFTSISIPVLYVIWRFSFVFPVDNYFYQKSIFWRKLFTYPFWALFQQYIFLAFFQAVQGYIFSSYKYCYLFFSINLFHDTYPDTSAHPIFFSGGHYLGWNL